MVERIEQQVLANDVGEAYEEMWRDVSDLFRGSPSAGDFLGKHGYALDPAWPSGHVFVHRAVLKTRQTQFYKFIVHVPDWGLVIPVASIVGLLEIAPGLAAVQAILAGQRDARLAAHSAAGVLARERQFTQVNAKA